MDTSKRHYLYIEPDVGVDQLELHQFLWESRFSVGLARLDLETDLDNLHREALLKRGPTSLLERGGLHEALLDRSPDDAPCLARLLNAMLMSLEPNRELAITDGYLAAPTADATYADLVDLVWDGVLERIDRLVLVTFPGKKTDPAVLAAIVAKAEARKPALTVVTHTSSTFHDRFWIADGDRGLFVGTSLNGLGKRYALADYLSTGDAKDIHAELSQLGLL